MTTAEPDRARATALVQRLSSDGVRIARVIHSDLFGRCRSKQYPLQTLPEVAGGIGYCAASIVEGLDGEPLSGGDFPGDHGFPDLSARPDLDTARIAPWDPDTVWILADLFDQERESPLCSRRTLARAGARLESAGFEAVTATEPEFYLLKQAGAGDVEAYSPGTGMAYTSGRRADPDGVLGRIQRQLIDFGIGVTAACREFSPGQFEVNLMHAPATVSADHGFLLKEAIKEMAAEEGLMATFMAKPFFAHEGSSLHLHLSLWRDGRNAFDAQHEPHGLSAECLAFTAGVLAHAPALSALAGPTVNSYKRLVPGGLAPTVTTWGLDDRLAYVRVPPERGDGARLEIRGGDASANPYLLSAGVLLAGLDGIERGLAPPDPGQGGAARLPGSLEQALDNLTEDTVLGEGLGLELVETFLALKRRECDRYRLAVTDWEWTEYAFHS